VNGGGRDDVSTTEVPVSLPRMTEVRKADPQGGRAGSARSSAPSVDVLVATYNSAATLEQSLSSVRRFLPVQRIIVVDRSSTDGTPEIARRWGAEVHDDRTGLGYARNLALRLADTDPVIFVDSDVVLTRPDFYARALEQYSSPHTAAVVGMTVGHRFRYGFPLGLTLVGRQWALDAAIPDDVQARETYFLQRAARRAGLRVRYVPESMEHRGTYRKARHWPEFQGAGIRRSSGWNPRELVYSLVVIQLMHMNSGRVRDMAYTPVFYAKLVRGFLHPGRWSRLDRTTVTA
jgi:glycosyltransferase involved in cell wall biosynthesis